MTREQADAYLSSMSEQQLRAATERAYNDLNEAKEEEWRECCPAGLYMFCQEMGRRGLVRIPPTPR